MGWRRISEETRRVTLSSLAFRIPDHHSCTVAIGQDQYVVWCEGEAVFVKHGVPEPLYLDQKGFLYVLSRPFYREVLFESAFTQVPAHQHVQIYKNIVFQLAPNDL